MLVPPPVPLISYRGGAFISSFALRPPIRFAISDEHLAILAEDTPALYRV